MPYKGNFRAAKGSLAVYAMSLLLTFGLNQLQKVFEHQTYSPKDPIYSKLVKPEFWYDKVTSFGPIKPIPGHVKTIEFSRGVEPENSFGAEHRCTARLFLAKLLVQLKKHPPSVIVIDRWFSKARPECREGEDGTDELVAAIQSMPMPVVIGLDEVNFNEVDGYCPGITLPSNTMILKEKFDFSGSNVSYGLVRFNEDMRKIPLGWFAYKSCNDASAANNRTLIPTIDLIAAYLASRTPQEKILSKLGLNSNFRSIHHPFSGFLRDDELLNYSAIQLLCGKKDPDPERWKQCSNNTADDLKLSELGGQIVIIGDRTDSDMHPTVIGKLPGFSVHANYVAALLSERVFLPIPLVYQILLSLLWFVAIEVVFKWQAARPGIALLTAFGATLILGFLIYSFLLIYCGLFAVVAVPSVMAIIGKWVSGRFGEKKNKEISHENHASAAAAANSSDFSGNMSINSKLPEQQTSSKSGDDQR